MGRRILRLGILPTLPSEEDLDQNDLKKVEKRDSQQVTFLLFLYYAWNVLMSLDSFGVNNNVSNHYDCDTSSATY